MAASQGHAICWTGNPWRPPSTSLPRFSLGFRSGSQKPKSSGARILGSIPALSSRPSLFLSIPSSPPVRPSVRPSVFPPSRPPFPRRRRRRGGRLLGACRLSSCLPPTTRPHRRMQPALWFRLTTQPTNHFTIPLRLFLVFVSAVCGSRCSLARPNPLPAGLRAWS
ncbi:hypothetical protein BKA80DRAFT_100863 [Phyllosticta citrichinensis]